MNMISKAHKLDKELGIVLYPLLTLIGAITLVYISNIEEKIMS